MALIEMWTDGASTGKVGSGGWAYMWRSETELVWDKGHEIDGTTNSRMEMVAVIEGLNSLPTRSTVKLYSDSSMIVNGVRDDWIGGWRERARGHPEGEWTNSRGKPVANRDLWEALEKAIARHAEVTFVKVKGHTKGTSMAAIGNRRVDSMAAKERAKASRLRMEREKGS